MRHSETILNVKRKIQGWIDAPLTSYGEELAREVGKHFEDEGIVFDHAYCSTCRRTEKTLNLVTGGSLPYECFDELREMNYGLLESEPWDMLSPSVKPHVDYCVLFGGESAAEVDERKVTSLGAIMERPEHKQVLAVSHGNSDYIFYLHWKHNNRIPDFDDYLGNCGAYIYAYEDGEFFLEEVFDPHPFPKD